MNTNPEIKEDRTLLKLKKDAVALLEGMRDGLENLECVLRQCMPDGDWELFEENSELRELWRRFCDAVYQDKDIEALSIANRMLQVIDPQQIATRWDEFRQSISSSVGASDGRKIVVALGGYLEKTLALFTPVQSGNCNG